MDIYDIICQKFQFRKLSLREKILASIFFLMVIELVFLRFIVLPKSRSYEDLKFNTDLKEKNYKIHTNYNGFDDFDDTNLTEFININNLNSNNINKNINSNIEILKVNGNIDSNETNKLLKMPNAYGFNKIELNRSTENDFTYLFEAFKPAEQILYKDLKNAYFSKSDSIPSEDINETQKVTPSNEKVISNTTTAYIKKDDKNYNKNKKIKINNSEIKNVTPQKEINNEVIKNSNITRIGIDESLINQNIITEDTSENTQNIFEISDEICVLEFKNANVMCFYSKNNIANEFIYFKLKNNRSNLNLELFVPNSFNGNFGVLNDLGEYKRYDGKLEIGKWNQLEFELENISEFYYLPNEDEEILFYLRDIYE